MQLQSLGKQLPFYLFAASLGSLVFGYYPLLAFGVIGGLHIDISLLYVVIALAVMSSLYLLWRNRTQLFKEPLWLVLLGFSLFMSLSVLWSSDHFRALVTVGFWWLLFGFISACIVHYPSLLRHQKIITKFVAGGFILTALLIMFQIVGEALGVANSWLLLPNAYDGAVFGVARPTGFALEPQFVGSLLIAPLCWLTWLTLAKKHSVLVSAGLLVVMTLLLITLSRGALIAGAIALIVLVVLQKPSLNRLGHLGLVIAGSIALFLVLIFSIAALRQDRISGYEAVGRSVNHASIGVIELPDESSGDDSKDSSNKKHTGGYVESSTTSRLSMSEKALDVWKTSPQTILFGVGIGGFDASLDASEQGPIRSIVNNYYLETLAELGLVGLAIFLGFFGLLLYRLAIKKHWLILSIVVGFLVQCFFFSGNANIVHVWAIVGLAIAALQHKSTKHKQRATRLLQ